MKNGRKNSAIFWLAVACIVTVGGAAALFSGEILNTLGFDDPPNLSTLIVEICVGLTIALIVYRYSKEQHKNNMKQQQANEALLSNIKNIVERQKKIIEDDESFRKRKHDHVVNNIRALFESVEDTLSTNLDRIDELERGNSEHRSQIKDNLRYHRRRILHYVRDLSTLLVTYGDSADPAFVRDASNVCRELEEWQTNEDPYLYPDTSRKKTEELVTRMKGLLENLSNPPV